MKFTSSQDHGDFITAHFDNGSAVSGSLVVACDGANSRLRKELFGKQGNADLQPSPFRMLGAKMYFSPEEMVAFRKCDPFFLQGTHSKDNTFGYFSVLDAPGNTEASTDKFLLQICISWLEQPGFMGKEEAVTIPETNEGRAELFRSLASSWTDPFRSLAMSATSDDEAKGLELKEWVPPEDLRSKGRAVLMGDSLHTMTMFRGDGANHALADVQDFDTHVAPLLEKPGTGTAELRSALSVYETTVVLRARPGLFASRRAGLDAHDFEGMTMQSPLLTPRMRNLQYDETE
ncbi:hypothetical protein NQ176_g2966 [Zarea fungicola]|uniref:Uncharacterized protein n=1 Tax=Zarea fungicola TaxID=93591 RepID=A0ACC1NMU8_9HYPO|nr:hypothetical protein NQ176_g2966 [Lecanicillium fungicola]